MEEDTDMVVACVEDLTAIIDKDGKDQRLYVEIFLDVIIFIPKAMETSQERNS